MHKRSLTFEWAVQTTPYICPLFCVTLTRGNYNTQEVCSKHPLHYVWVEVKLMARELAVSRPVYSIYTRGKQAWLCPCWCAHISIRGQQCCMRSLVVCRQMGHISWGVPKGEISATPLGPESTNTVWGKCPKGVHQSVMVVLHHLVLL